MCIYDYQEMLKRKVESEGREAESRAAKKPTHIVEFDLCTRTYNSSYQEKHLTNHYICAIITNVI